MAEQTRPQESTPAQTKGKRDTTAQLSRREPFSSSLMSPFSSSPFSSIFRRWNDEMDRLFEDFGLGGRRELQTGGLSSWTPQVEVTQKGNDLIVRADLPGVKREDVHVDVADDVLTIQGERQHEEKEEQEGWYRSERSYGSFYRTVPLPEGTITDSAKATFKDGVLEIILQAPSREVSRGRRLEIK